MKKLIAIAAIGALAACAEAEAPEAEEVAVEETAPLVAPGSYVALYDDGTEQNFTTNADGTWSGENLEGEAVSGTYRDIEGKVCFRTEGGSAEDSCWANGEVAEDGTWMATSDAGVTVTVRPAEAEVEAEAEMDAEG